MNRFAALVLALVAAPSVAAAEVEIGGIAGVHMFSESNGLGVQPMENANSLKNSALFGLRLGVFFGAFGVEAEAGVIPTEPRELVFDVTNLAYRANLVYQLRSENPANKFIPFVLAGAGQIRLIDSQNEDEIAKDAILGIHAGVGIKYKAAHNWGVRADLRGMLVPSSAPPDGGNTFDFEFLLSMYKEFGRKQPISVIAPEPPPPVDEDPDKDGILGAADQCPNEPEDFDGFQDEDGCPDPDNDGDGIADAADKCPLEPEDKDDFQDDDGCPDLDNDGDGVPDAADKCVNEPETKNGYEDDDGCPDEIPQKLKEFTGVIEGIQFKTGAADLTAGSTKVLDKAIAVLTEFPTIKLEIQGHTDDTKVANTKKFADNVALSQARAETVKAYFVKKGIDESRLVAVGYGDSMPVESPEGLKGKALTNARTKNRRVEFKLITDDAAAPAADAAAPAQP
jgi:OOP family OmpA-OmpF porin